MTIKVFENNNLCNLVFAYFTLKDYGNMKVNHAFRMRIEKLQRDGILKQLGTEIVQLLGEERLKSAAILNTYAGQLVPRKDLPKHASFFIGSNRLGRAYAIAKVDFLLEGACDSCFSLAVKKDVIQVTAGDEIQRFKMFARILKGKSIQLKNLPLSSEESELEQTCCFSTRIFSCWRTCCFPTRETPSSPLPCLMTLGK